MHFKCVQNVGHLSRPQSVTNLELCEYLLYVSEAALHDV